MVYPSKYQLGLVLINFVDAINDATNWAKLVVSLLLELSKLSVLWLLRRLCLPQCSREVWSLDLDPGGFTPTLVHLPPHVCQSTVKLRRRLWRHLKLLLLGLCHTQESGKLKIHYRRSASDKNSLPEYVTSTLSVDVFQSNTKKSSVFHILFHTTVSARPQNRWKRANRLGSSRLKINRLGGFQHLVSTHTLGQLL